MTLTIQATSNDSKRWNIAITKKGFEEINSAKEVIKRVTVQEIKRLFLKEQHSRFRHREIIAPGE
jgi:hypothetical protein